MLYYTKILYYAMLCYDDLLYYDILYYTITYYDLLSTIQYCVEMTKAVDMWSEVAVFAVTVYEGKVTIGRMYLLASKARHHSFSMHYHLAFNIFFYSNSYNLYIVR